MSPSASTWTRQRVESRLIAAFRLMPSLPVYRLGSGIRLADGASTPLTEVLGWAALLADDEPGRIALLSWARCRGTGASFADLCRERGWKQSVIERRRRRAADAIASKLSGT